MSAGPAGAMVCGFFDLAGGVGGLAWELGERGGLLLSGDKVEEAETRISVDEGTTRLEMGTDERGVEVTLVPRPGMLVLETAGNGAPPYSQEAAIGAARLRSEGWGKNLQCVGHLSRWDDDLLGGLGTFRHLTVEGPAGSLIMLTARGEPDAHGHGEEEVDAWALEPEGGFTRFGESLLSTQFDEAGRQTRFGLELWGEGDERADRAAATRGAGTRLGGTEGGDGRVSAAMMRCSVEGTPGLGSYLIRRA